MTTRTSPPQNSFAAGEISPLLRQRNDYARFQTGLAKCRGFLPLLQGGFTRAPGTIFRGQTLNDSAGRLIRFEFAENDAVVLEFTPMKMRVWRYGVLVAGFELDTPYDAAAIARLDWGQSADVIYLADGQIPIQKLSRLALNNWTIAPFLPATGPFRTGNTDTGLTIVASGEIGAVTLTANFNLFEANHVGALIQLEAVDWYNVPLWSGNTTVAVGQLVRRDGNVYELVQGTTTGVNPPDHTEGVAQTQVSPAVKWAHLSTYTGIVRITAVNSPTSATATVIRRLPRAVVDSPTYRWAEGAWSERFGYPRALEIYEQRLCAASTPSDPRTLWFSGIGDFNDLAPATDDLGAFSYVIAGENTVNAIVWIRRGRNGLHIGALGEEYSTRLNDPAGVLSATTVAFKPDSTIGSAAVRPVAPRGDPIFVSRDRARLFEIAYSLQSDSNRALELSLPAEHLGIEGFQELAFQSAPQRLTWIRRGNGDVAVFLYDPDESILGWAVISVAGGEVEALAVTPDPTGAADVVTLIVKRVLNGATVRCIEEVAPVFGLSHGAIPLADAIHLFCCQTFDLGAPAAEVSVPHLAGETVFAWTDAGGYGPLTVDGLGNVVLPALVTRGCIGLFDDTHLTETLPIRAEARDGDTTGRLHRLEADLGIAVHNTAAGRVATVERDLGRPERAGLPKDILHRQVASDLVAMHSGVTRIPADSGQTYEPALRITPVGGAPLTVTSLVPSITEHGT